MSTIKFKNSKGEWIDLYIPTVASEKVMADMTALENKLNAVKSAARNMQVPFIKIVRPAEDDHLYVMQGGVCDGEYIYFYYYTKPADRSIVNSMHICKYSKSGTLLVTKSFEGTEKDAGEPYYHGNDMTYNPNTNQLFVLGYYDDKETRIRVVNTETLEIEDTIIISGVGLSSIAYNTEQNCYIGAIRGKSDIKVLDSNWNPISTITMPDKIKEGYSKQGIECDANYIYVPYWVSATDINIIDVYDWDGNLKKTWDLSHMPNLHEIEWLCKKDDNTFYLGAGASSVYEYMTVFEINTALC